MDSLTRSSWPGRFLMASNVAAMRSHNSSTLVTGVDHSISQISTQQWISRNMFTFRPMLIGTFLLN